MQIIDLNFLKRKVGNELIEKGYRVYIREYSMGPSGGFGYLFQFIVDSQDMTGGIDFWTHGQMEIELWSIKKNDDVLKTIFFDSYKLPEAQEKIREFINYLLPDFNYTSAEYKNGKH